MCSSDLEPMLYNDLGLVLFELGDVAEAREIFLKLSREHSTEATYVYNYAWMLYRDKTDMREIACEVLSKFLDTAGFDVESAFFLAQIIAEMRRQEKFPMRWTFCVRCCRFGRNTTRPGRFLAGCRKRAETFVRLRTHTPEL